MKTHPLKNIRVAFLMTFALLANLTEVLGVSRTV